jgi:predicted metal-binding protein
MENLEYAYICRCVRRETEKRKRDSTRRGSVYNTALTTGSEEKAQSQAREREIEDDNSASNCRRRRQVSANQREKTTILPGIVEREKKRTSESDRVIVD